jgi:hypothetical protein
MSDIARICLLMLRPLLLTIAIELPLGLFFVRERTWREALIISLAQVVTNPTVQLVSLFTHWSPQDALFSASWGAILLAEVAAVVVEGLLYRASGITDHPWRMSLVLNATSLAIGLLL